MDADQPVLPQIPQYEIEPLSALYMNLKSWDTAIRVYLFGSRASGQNSVESDYDLAIISDNFSQMEASERWKLVQMKFKPPIRNFILDPKCFTRREWDDSVGTILGQEIRAYGVDVQDLVGFKLSE